MVGKPAAISKPESEQEPMEASEIALRSAARPLIQQQAGGTHPSDDVYAKKEVLTTR